MSRKRQTKKTPKEEEISSSESENSLNEENLADIIGEEQGTVWDGNTRRSTRKKKPVEKLTAPKKTTKKSTLKPRNRPKELDENFDYSSYLPSLRTRKNIKYQEETEEDTTPIKKGRKKIPSDDEEEEEEEEEEEQQEEEEEKSEMEEEEEEEPKKKAYKGKKRGRKPKKKTQKTEEEDDEKEEKEKKEEHSRKIEDSDSGEEEEDDIEKILACRLEELKKDEKDKTPEVEYLVKYKGKSFLHAEWVNKEDIMAFPGGKQKLNRFDKKFDHTSFVHLDGEYFNPDYLIVERIVDDVIYKDRKCYLVKWKGLSYAECSWEFEEEIHESEKVKQYLKFKTIPKEEDRVIPPRPHARTWKKMEESPKFKGTNQLREYQLEGLNWLLFCWYNKRNSCLADEMGLGKTIQTVSMLETLRAQHKLRGPFLIVAPLSTIQHWQREFESWSELNVVVFHGGAEARQKIMEYEWNYFDKKNKPVPGIFKWNVLITTYEIILSESSKLSKINWQYMVVDEGHRLKNKNSKLLEVLKGFKTNHKLLLTGTPIQNDISELWSLLNFLEPSKFDSLEEFMEEYGVMKDSTEAKKLHDLIEPYLLRRLKEDVEKSIPPKEEIIVEVVPTTIQKKYYRAVVDKNREFLEKGTSKKNVPNLVNILMEIRKICNHPFLLKGVEHQITEGMKPDEVNETLIKSSSKLLLVDKLLKKLREGNHKVLIFSQMVQLLTILEDYLNYRNYPYERLDGSIRGDERQAAIDRFSDPNRDNFVFLVSTRAGGVGINLTAADTVIIFDSDFNPQNDLQAQARCHRIGQTKDVKIYRLLTKNTKEKEMFEKASMKLGLDRAILNMEGSDIFETGSKKEGKAGLNNEEIDTLLKYGAYSAYKKETTEEEKMLLEQDIDTILERSSTIIRYDSQKEQTSEKGISNFSKASFCFSENDMEVDINDKDFWNKILPENKSPEGLLRKLHSERGFETEEEKEQFMKDLENAVQEQISAFQKFKHREDDTIQNLLTQSFYSSFFNEKQKNQVREMQKSLQGRRGNRQRDSSDDEEEEIEEDEEEIKKTGGGNLSVKKGGWYKAERNRFQKSVLELGWGRWKDIRTNKLSTHSEEDIHSFAECFVFQSKKSTTEEAHHEFLDNLIFSTSTPDETIETEVKKLTTTVQKKMIAVSPITITIPEKERGPYHLQMISVRDKQVNRCIRSIQFDKNPKSYTLSSPGFHGDFYIKVITKDHTLKSDTFTIEGCHPLIEEDEWIKMAQRGIKNWIKKFKFTNDLSQVFKNYENNFTSSDVPGLQIKKPSEWWDNECDKDLLVGFRNHGFGRVNELKDDEKLCFKKKFEKYISELKTAKERKKEQENFPSISIMNKRANKLIEKLLKNTKSSEKKDEKVQQPSTTIDEWSKREKQDLQRCLTLYGKCPDVKGVTRWNILIARAKLRKTIESTQEYVNKLLENCQKIVNNETVEDSIKEEIGPQTARKILERVSVMDKLAEFVHPNIDESKKNLTFLKIQGNGLPKWWKTLHDYELIDGVKENGFDFKKIFSEEKYSFKNEKKGQPREGLCLTRLEQIGNFFEKVAQHGSPTKENSHIWELTPKKSHVKPNKEIKKKAKEEEDEENVFEPEPPKKGKITDFFDKEKRKREEEDEENKSEKKIKMDQ